MKPKRWIIGWAEETGWSALVYVGIPSIPYLTILAILVFVSNGASKVTHDVGFPISLIAWFSLFWTIAWFNRSTERFFAHLKKAGLFDEKELEQKEHDVRINQVTLAWAALLTATGGVVVFYAVVAHLSTGFTDVEGLYSGPITVAMDYTSWPYIVVASVIDFAIVFLVLLSAIRLMRTSYELMDVSDRWREVLSRGNELPHLRDSLDSETQAFIGSYSIMILSSELTITLPLALLAPVLLGQASTFYHSVLLLYFVFLASYLALTLPTFVVSVVPMNDLLRQLRTRQMNQIKSQIVDLQRDAEAPEQSVSARTLASSEVVRLKANAQDLERSGAWPFHVRGLFDVRFIANTVAALVAPIITSTVALGVHF